MMAKLSNSKAFFLTIVLTLFVFSYSHTAQAVLIGDFNGDGILNALDADFLTFEIAAGTNSLFLDVNSDGVVNLADLDDWFPQYSSNSGIPLEIALVDVDFNTINTIMDYQIILSNLGEFTSNFTDGDLNATGLVDTADLDLYKSRGGIIPEPATLTLLAFGAMFAGRRRRV